MRECRVRYPRGTPVCLYAGRCQGRVRGELLSDVYSTVQRVEIRLCPPEDGVVSRYWYEVEVDRGEEP
jgi:hypothetical protein